MKTYGEWRYSSYILQLGNGWRWVASFTSQPLYLRGKRPRYPLDRRLCGSQCQSRLSGVEKNQLSLPGIEPRSSSPLLYQPSYAGSNCRCTWTNFFLALAVIMATDSTVISVIRTFHYETNVKPLVLIVHEHFRYRREGVVFHTVHDVMNNPEQGFRNIFTHAPETGSE
jgi:hypothetical protein